MENEFDFFNKLSLGDLSKSRLGGYGTFNYTAPTVNTNLSTSLNPNLSTGLNTGIQTLAPTPIIPGPISPFIGGAGPDNDNSGFTTNNFGTYTGPKDYDPKDFSTPIGADYEFDAAITPGLSGLRQLGDYAKKNYGYMAMNAIIPFSGIFAKGFAENRRRAELKAEEERKQALKNFYERQQIQEDIDLSETDINIASERGVAINSNEAIGTPNPNSLYGKSQGYIGGNANPFTQTGWSGAVKSEEAKNNYDAGQAQKAADEAAAATREAARSRSTGNRGGDRSPASDFSDDTPGTPFARGGRIRYGTGGIVTL